jgi:hypothetical protein
MNIISIIENMTFEYFRVLFYAYSVPLCSNSNTRLLKEVREPLFSGVCKINE